MPVDRKTWATAYALQSRSDFAIYELLFDQPDVEMCHWLHYLQMASEKIAKAYRFRDTDTPTEELLTSHVAFSKFIESYMYSEGVRARYPKKQAMLNGMARTFRRIAREIEILAPAVERDIQPQNTEYPWEAGEKVIIPCQYSYPLVSTLRTPQGLSFLRHINEAIILFESIHIS